jgi:hypothetical protein
MMDPDENLREQREIVSRMLAGGPHYSSEEQVADGDRLAELVQALDVWISAGGFLPEDWRKALAGG